MVTTGLILAQKGDWDYGNLIYLGFFAVVGVLNWVASKYKEWQEGSKQTGGAQVDSDEEVIFEVSLDDDDEFVLRPTTAKDAKPSVPPARKPMVAPVPPAVYQQPRPQESRTQRPQATPPRPVPRPTAPVARPVQARQPSPPQRKQQTRQQPVKQATKRRRTEVPAETPVPAQMNIAGIPVRSLKDAVILSEILAPPISVRQIEGRNSGFERPDF